MIAIYHGWIEQINRNYTDPIERQRAVGITTMLLVMLALWFISLFVFIAPLLTSNTSIPVEAAVTFIALPMIFYGIHRLIQSGDLRWGRYAFIGIVTLSCYLYMFGGLDTGYIILLAVSLITAGLILEERELLVFLVAFNLIAFLITYNIRLQDGDVQSHITILILLVMTSILVIFLLRVFAGSTHVLVRQGQKGVQRMGLMGNFNVDLAKARDENGAMMALSNLLNERLLYSYIQLHLFDNNRKLLTHVRTGVGTRYSVTSTDLNTVAESAFKVALDTRRPVVITPQDPPVRRLHLLPSMKYGMIIPLIYSGSETIGLLDIQSNNLDFPFTTSEQALLEMVGQDFVTRLKYIRETAVLNQILSERNEVANRLEKQIAKLTQQFEQSSGNDWREYIESRGANAFGFNIQRDDMLITPANDLPDNLRTALASGELVVQAAGKGQVINVPIILRGVVLGAMEFAVPKNYVIGERQKDMVQIVAQRLALALENARLIEQSRSQADREHTASEVANILIGQQDLSSLLDVAAESFNEALGAIYTHIYLEPDVKLSEFVNGEAR